MATPVEFDARLEVAGVTVAPFPVIVGMGSGRLGIRTGTMDIGGWTVTELDIALSDGALIIDVEGERLSLSFDRPTDGLVAIIAELDRPPA